VIERRAAREKHGHAKPTGDRGESFKHCPICDGYVDILDLS
jgi:hypothetical protein